MASEREDQAVEHKETRSVTDRGFRSDCACGAHWSHGPKTPIEEMDSIFRSHVKYFENRTMVL